MNGISRCCLFPTGRNEPTQSCYKNCFASAKDMARERTNTPPAAKCQASNVGKKEGCPARSFFNAFFRTFGNRDLRSKTKNGGRTTEIHCLSVMEGIHTVQRGQVWNSFTVRSSATPRLDMCFPPQQTADMNASHLIFHRLCNAFTIKSNRPRNSI